MRRRILLRGAVAIALLLGLVVWPLSQLTDTGIERRAKEALGVVEPGCEATVVESPGWSRAGRLPEDRDEPRGVAVGDRIYLAGGILEILEFGKPSMVPGVERIAVENTRALTEFDPRTGRYTELPPLPKPLNHIGFVTYGGDLYVVGGHGELLFGVDPQSGFYRYDIETRTWSTLPPLPTPRGAVAAGVVGNTLVVAGGMRDGRQLRVTETYDFRTQRWSSAADLPTSRDHVPGAVIDGRFYVVGGRSGTDDSIDDVDAYDPKADRWESLPPLPVPAGGGEALAVDGALVAMGGGDDRERRVTGAVQRLDLGTRTWTQWPQMRTRRHGFAGVTFEGSVYTFGGSPCALFAASDIVDRFDPPRR